MVAPYQLSSKPNVVIRLSDGAMIPFSPGNADYQAYLVYLAGGNTPLPAAVPPPTTSLSFNQFVSRLTPTEQGALATAAQTNAQILLWLALGAAANDVDLTSPQTAGGLQLLVSVGVITSDRVATILTP